MYLWKCFVFVEVFCDWLKRFAPMSHRTQDLRESSQGGGGHEDIEGGLRKFLYTRKGGSENLYISKTTGAGSGVCSTLGVQNLNPQQEKALAEFLSGSDVFVNLPTGYGKPLMYQAPLMAIEFSKQYLTAIFQTKA